MLVWLLFLSLASCGSCYAFASMGMLEARIRILTNNTQKPVFSPQQVVSCSQYSQGKYSGAYETFINNDTAEVHSKLTHLPLTHDFVLLSQSSGKLHIIVLFFFIFLKDS